MSKILANSKKEEFTLAELNAQLSVECRRYVHFSVTKAPDETRIRCYRTIKFLQDRIQEKLLNSERNKELDFAVEYLKTLTMRSEKYDRVLALVDVEFVIDLVQRKQFTQWHQQHQTANVNKTDVDSLMSKTHAS